VLSKLSINIKSRLQQQSWLAFICVLTEWRRLEPRRRRKILAPPPAEFSTARRLRRLAASQKRFGGAAEGSTQ